MPQTSQSGSQVNPSEKELAYAILVLERQLEAYQRLHAEDIASLRAALQEIKARIIDCVQTAAAEGESNDSGGQTLNHSY